MLSAKRNLGGLVLVVACVLLPLGIWGPGLWDPWEMNPAFVARRMAEAPAVLVAEGRPRTDAASLAAALAGDLSGDASVDATADNASVGAALEAARTRLGDRVYRVAVMDLDARVKSDTDGDGIRALGDLLSAVVPLNRSTTFLLVSPSGQSTPATVLEKARLRVAQAAGDDDEVVDLVDGQVHPVASRADVSAAVRDALPGDAFLAQFKNGGRTVFQPPLEPFLVSLSLRVFGLTEFAARLPAALLVVLSLVLVGLAVRRRLGEVESALAVAVLATSPLVLLSGRLVGDSAATMLALASAGVCFASVTRAVGCPWTMIGLLGSMVLAYLSGGMLAAVTVAGAVVAYPLVARSTDRRVLGAAAAVTVLAGVLAVLTFVPDGAFWRQFRFTGATWAGGLKDEARTFDVAFKTVGFGLFPWSALLPLAVAAAARPGQADRSDRLVALLFAASPFLSLMIGARPFHQVVYLGTPAVAVLVALYLRDLDDDPVETRLLAFIGFGLFLAVLKDLLHSPASLVSWLASDPPFSEPGKGDLSFPEVVRLSLPAKAFAFAAGLSLLVAGGRLVTAVRALPGLLRRGRTFLIVMIVMAGLIVADLAIFLALKWDVVSGDAGPDARVGAVLVRIFLTGPDILGLYLLTAFLVGTRYADRLHALALRFLGPDRTASAGTALMALESPRATGTWMALGATGFALSLAFGLVPELSWHLSQKHMIETWEDSAARSPGDLYRHGVFAAKGSEDSNFYTAAIPELSSRSAVLERLKDTAKRTFVLVPKNQWSEILSAFRAANGGKFLPLLDDRSSRFVLVASSLAPGEEDRDWLAQATLTQAKFDALTGVNRTSVNFDNKIEAVGWSVEPEAVRRGGKAILKTYFKTLDKVGASYRIFLHVDRVGSSSRIHGDHWILNQARETEDQTSCVGCYATTHWLKGDIVVDTYSIDIPIGEPSGPYDIWMGFYNPSGDKRLPVKDFDKEKVKHDGQNRVRLGSMTVQ